MRGLVTVAISALLTTCTAAATLRGRLLSSTCGVTSFVGIDDNLPGSINSTDIQTILSTPLSLMPVSFEIIIPYTLRYETTLQFRITNAIDLASYNTITAFHPTAIDVFGRVTESNARRRCTENVDPQIVSVHEKVAVAMAFAYAFTEMAPETKGPMGDFLGAIGLGGVWSTMNDPNFDGCSNIVLPWGLAKCAADEIVDYVATDGWNADGSLTRQYNRRRYSDYDYEDAEGDRYTRYVPNNDPWKISNDRDWSPLLESNTLGFFYHQESVNPYIGINAKAFGLPADRCEFFNARKAPNPRYKYVEELQQVYEATAALAVNETKMILMEAFDSKLTSIALMQGYFSVASGFTEFEYWSLQAAVTTAIYDVILLAWREKRRWDLVRPTTVAQYFGRGQTVTTWAGPYQGLQTIPGEEWEPYIRTMPHGEYPSGSSCMCHAFAEAMAHHTGSDAIPAASQWATTITYKAGSSKVQPGAIPSQDISVTFPTWSSVAEECTASRHYGGIHFRAALPAGKDLCTGIAPGVLDKMDLLINGDPAGSFADFNDRDIDVCPL